MLLRLRKNLSDEGRSSVLSVCDALGYEHRTLDEEGQLLELKGACRPEHRTLFEDLPSVISVLDASDAPERADRTPEREGRCVRVGAAAFGGGYASLIAGPCAVEDEELLLEIAGAARSAGAALLRGGAFKPRTSPYSFQGLGLEGLRYLQRARAEVGLPIVTEVLDPRNIEAVHEVTDVFQVGSRGMGNSPLLRELGQSDKPVLLKRGMAATVREFLLAAEYVLAGGNEELILCERGVRGFDQVTRNVLDLGSVAHLKRATWMPVIVDPSHAAGRADLVRPLARAGIAAGADGLMIELHPRPHAARSDGPQAVSAAELGAIAADAKALLELDGRVFSAPEPTPTHAT